MFGTFALCYIGGMVYVMADNGFISLNGVALAHGGIYALCVYIAAEISGAHFNPAVSVAMFMLNEREFMDMTLYCCAQLLGAMIAGGF